MFFCCFKLGAWSYSYHVWVCAYSFVSHKALEIKWDFFQKQILQSEFRTWFCTVFFYSFGFSFLPFCQSQICDNISLFFSPPVTVQNVGNLVLNIVTQKKWQKIYRQPSGCTRKNKVENSFNSYLLLLIQIYHEEITKRYLIFCLLL